MTQLIKTRYDADVRPHERKLGRLDRSIARWDRGVDRRLSNYEQRFERAARATQVLERALQGLAAAASIEAVRRYAESWRSVERSLQSMGEAGEDANNKILSAALRIRGQIDDVALGVAKLARATSADLDTTIRRFETLNKLFASANLTSAERSAVSIQLSQALQSGVLSGDEFRSVREAAPVEFLDALSEAAGVTRRELRGVAEAQKLTTDIVLEALDGLATQADAAFGSLAITGEEAFSQLNTGMTAFIGRLDESARLSASFNGAIASMGEFLASGSEEAEAFGTALRFAGQFALAFGAGRVISGLGAYTSGLVEAQRAHVALRREAVATAAADVQSTRQQVAASEQLLVQRRLELEQRRAAGARIVRDEQRYTRAVEQYRVAQEAATVAATRHTTAQAALASATSVSARAMRGLQGAMAFFGGPVGLAITGVALGFAQFSASAASARAEIERLRGPIGAVESGVAALERVALSYADAIRQTGDEQDAASQLIVARSAEEFEAKRDLLELEVKRLKVAQDRRRELIAEARARVAANAPLAARPDRQRGRFDLDAVNRGRLERRAEAQDDLTELQARLVITNNEIRDAEALLARSRDEIVADVRAGRSLSPRPAPPTPPATSAAAEPAPINVNPAPSRAPVPTFNPRGGAPSLLISRADFDEAQQFLDSLLTDEERLARQRERLLELQPAIAEAIRQEAAARGEVITAAEAQAQAQERIAEATNAQSRAFRSIAEDMTQAAIRGESLGQILGSIGQRLVSIGANAALGGVFGDGGLFSAAVGGLRGVIGFRSGGYTGPGGVNQPAGVVHGQEFVVNAEATRRHRALLEAINSGLPGFREGGLAGRPTRLPTPAAAPMLPVRSSGGASITIAPVITVEAAAGVDGQAVGRQVAETVRALTLDTLRRETRPGGMVYNQMKGA